jgi:hypothetical protein
LDSDILDDLRHSREAFKRHFLTTYASRAASPTESNTARHLQSGKVRFYKRFASPDAGSLTGPEAELEALFDLRPQRVDTCPDPVKWWGAHRAQFPLLSRFARDVLSIPGEHVLDSDL